MSIVDRLNSLFVGRLRRDKPQVVVDTGAVRVIAKDGSARLFELAHLTAATLYHRDVYVGDAIVLRLTFVDGDTIEFFQDDPQWRTLIAALDDSGMIATRSAVWQLQAIGDGAGAPPRELI